MSESDEGFDPYHKWLGIPPAQQPPHHYRLLGLNLFERDPDVIDTAADRQMAHVRTYQTGRHAAASQRLLNELAAARICLLDAEKKQVYDAQLRARLLKEQEERGRAQGAAAPAPFGELLGGAWRYCVVETRRSWISRTRLPAAYWRLGVQLHAEGRGRAQFEEIYARLDATANELAAAAPPAPAPAEAAAAPRPGPVQRLRAWLRRTLVDRRRTRLLGQLGKAAYEADRQQCGPPNLVQAIEEELARLASLASEAHDLSRVAPGQALSPRRLAWTVLACIVGIVLFFLLLRWIL